MGKLNDEEKKWLHEQILLFEKEFNKPVIEMNDIIKAASSPEEGLENILIRFDDLAG